MVNYMNILLIRDLIRETTIGNKSEYLHCKEKNPIKLLEIFM